MTDNQAGSGIPEDVEGVKVLDVAEDKRAESYGADVVLTVSEKFVFGELAAEFESYKDDAFMAEADEYLEMLATVLIEQEELESDYALAEGQENAAATMPIIHYDGGEYEGSLGFVVYTTRSNIEAVGRAMNKAAEWTRLVPVEGNNAAE